MATTASIDTAALRSSEFPMTDVWAYLNHPSVGPLPRRTVRALDEINRMFAVPHRWETGVVTALRSRAVRVAPTFYNDAGDIDRLIEALPEPAARQFVTVTLPDC